MAGIDFAVWSIHTRQSCFIHYKNSVFGGLPLKDYIEERAVEIANYIIETKATVRQTAKKFGISKSTVHKDVTERLLVINAVGQTGQIGA